jgi:hypothetical protein
MGAAIQRHFKFIAPLFADHRHVETTSMDMRKPMTEVDKQEEEGDIELHPERAAAP